MSETNLQLQIKDKSIVLIDWANIRNQQKKLGWNIDLEKLYKWLSSHDEIKRVQFFYGHENNEKSRKFLKKIESFGYQVITKQVKYLKTNTGLKLKCDFDVEITTEIMKQFNDFNSLILFSGDGDFAYPLQECLSHTKTVKIISHENFIGREIWELKKSDNKCLTSILSLQKLSLIKSTPPAETDGKK